MVYDGKGSNNKTNKEQNIDGHVEEDYRITDYTKEDIQEYLDKVKKLVEKDKYSIPLQENRNKNKKFVERYNLNNKKRKKILNSLNVYDFCYGTRNINQGYEHEILYVFSKGYEDTFPEGHKKIQIYIKTNLIESGEKSPYDFVIVISFHEYTGKVKTLFERK